MGLDLSKHHITSKIQSGEYFKEARDWYAVKYLSIKTQHLYLFIIALLSVCSTYIAIGTSILNQTTISYPIPLYFNNSMQYFPQILPLSQPGDTINISVGRYMVNYYITKREGYNPLKIDPENWAKHLSQIQSLSSRRVFSQYQAWVDPTINPDSPLITYKDNTERTIDIKDIIFDRNEAIPSSAVVMFTSTEKTRDSAISSNWSAEIKFSMADAGMAIEDPSDMQFVVTAYNATPIN